MADRPVLLEPPVRVYECPSCGHRQTSRALLGVIHSCPQLGGITAPMQLADRYGIIGDAAHHRLVERGDWIAGEAVQHGGVMAVHTERPDGSHDTLVFAPTARTTTRRP